MSSLGEIENPHREELVLILLVLGRGMITSGVHKATADGGPRPRQRSIKDTPNFFRKETRPSEPSMTPPQVGPPPVTATVPPHNKLLFSIL